MSKPKWQMKPPMTCSCTHVEPGQQSSIHSWTIPYMVHASLEACLYSTPWAREETNRKLFGLEDEAAATCLVHIMHKSRAGNSAGGEKMRANSSLLGFSSRFLSGVLSLPRSKLETVGIPNLNKSGWRLGVALCSSGGTRQAAAVVR